MMLNSSFSIDQINQNLLDSGATKNANNYCDAFTNFRPIREIANIANGKAIVSYRQGDVVKIIIYGDAIF